MCTLLSTCDKLRMGRDKIWHTGGYEDRSYDRDRPRELFKAVCSECGAECEMPFKPTQGRPIYYRDCYRKHQPVERNKEQVLDCHWAGSEPSARSNDSMYLIGNAPRCTHYRPLSFCGQPCASCHTS